jgi:hypothetical protein
LLNQLLRYQAGNDLWMKSLPYLSNGEIGQICDNIRSNSALLSAISQTHGNPSQLYGFASGFVGILMAEAEKRHVPSALELKSFTLDDPAKQDLVKILRAVDAAPALSAAQDLPTDGSDRPQADKLFDLMEHHFATCSSDEFWSQDSVRGQYEFFGLSMNIAHLKMLAARIAGGGAIAGADLDMLKRLLKDSDGRPNTELAGVISKIDTEAEPQEVLRDLAAIVRQYYFGERQLFDGGTREYYKGKLLNLNRGAGKVLTDLETANEAGAMIAALEAAFGHSILGTDFTQKLVARSFETIAAPEQPLIFHP